MIKNRGTRSNSRADLPERVSMKQFGACGENFSRAMHKTSNFFITRRPNASKQVLARLAWSGGRDEGGLEGVWALHQDERKFCRFDFSEFLLKTAENRSILC